MKHNPMDIPVFLLPFLVLLVIDFNAKKALSSSIFSSSISDLQAFRTTVILPQNSNTLKSFFYHSVTLYWLSASPSYAKFHKSQLSLQVLYVWYQNFKQMYSSDNDN